VALVLVAAALYTAFRTQRFTGAGTQDLGTIKVPVSSTLEWRCPGCADFAVMGYTSSGSELNVFELNRSSGSKKIGAGVYQEVIVDAPPNGGESEPHWTIEIRPE
jgi:hypothetical protein